MLSWKLLAAKLRKKEFSDLKKIWKQKMDCIVKKSYTAKIPSNTVNDSVCIYGRGDINTIERSLIVIEKSCKKTLSNWFHLGVLNCLIKSNI